MHSKMKQLFILFYLFVLVGCTPISTFQSPAILQDRNAIGIGAAIFQFEKEDVSPPSDINVWYRSPLSTRSEFGLRVGLLEGISADFKYNFLRAGQLFFSADFSLSFASESHTSENHFFVSPMILFGTEKFYGGFKYIIPSSSRKAEPLRVLMLGASIGNKVRIMPEINFWGEPDSRRTFITYGLGILFTFVKK